MEIARLDISRSETEVVRRPVVTLPVVPLMVATPHPDAAGHSDMDLLFDGGAGQLWSVSLSRAEAAALAQGLVESLRAVSQRDVEAAKGAVDDVIRRAPKPGRS